MNAVEESVHKWAWKDGWTHGRVHGYVPWSIFVKLESGNRAAEETLFFQDFGFGVREFWRSIDEPDLTEVTDADIYDARNTCGRFGNRPIEAGPEDAALRLAQAGYRTEPDGEARAQAAAWKSFMSAEDLATVLAEERRADLTARVKECPRCAAGAPLYVHRWGFVHAAEYGPGKCPAVAVHFELDTRAEELPENLFPGREYFRLKDALEDDIRLVSSPGQIRSHSAYGKIVLLGKAAVPLILADLSDGGCRGRWAPLTLADITGEARAPEAAWWLGWGHAKGLL